MSLNCLSDGLNDKKLLFMTWQTSLLKGKKLSIKHTLAAVFTLSKTLPTKFYITATFIESLWWSTVVTFHSEIGEKSAAVPSLMRDMKRDAWEDSDPNKKLQ